MISDESEEDLTPSTQRRRRTQASNDGDEEERSEGDARDEEIDGEADDQDQIVKKLVRYALACEFQRITIKRTGISEKGQPKPRKAPMQS